MAVRRLLSAGASLEARSAATGLTPLETLRETSRREVLDAASFVRLMDCARAVNDRLAYDEMQRLAKLVPPPALSVSEDDEAQLEAWAQRVKDEKGRLEALMQENQRRGGAEQLEQRLFAAICEAKGANTFDAVSAVTQRLSRERNARKPTPAELALRRKRDQGNALLIASKASRMLRRPVAFG